jgi:DNA-binding MarR family transcriptional regulator
MVRQGVSSPYDLLKTAGLSVGASKNTLDRLEVQSQLKRRISNSPRKKLTYSLTATGRKRLTSELSLLLKNLPTEFESAVRLACLAIYHRRRDDAVRLLLALADARESFVPNRQPQKPARTALNKWILESCAAARRSGEVKVLRDLAKLLKSGKL